MEKQLNLNIYKGKHGGRRPNSGRKRIHSKGVAHKTRTKITANTPFHINFKYRTFIRTEILLEHFILAIMKSQKHGFRIIHFSLQTNHVHLIAEAQNNQILVKGMRSLTNSFVKRIAMTKKLKGSIQIERYHLHVLRTLKEAKNAIDYVLYNRKHHTGEHLEDSFSSVVQSFFLDEGRSWPIKSLS
jgi:REP element-mobilizing transposase RayT